jgi:phosphonoacetaldehyde hydrolase
MSTSLKNLKALMLDWAGTTVDFGSCAPAIVFQEVFHQRGVDITVEQAREPMGMAKREHIAAIANMPAVRQAWMAKYGSPCSECDIDAMYVEFLPIQKRTLHNHSGVIDGVPQAIERCRHWGLKIGSSTGYTRELMTIVTAAARQQGYDPDCVMCAEDAPRGRPAPYLIYEAARQMDIYPLWSFVVVDDTPVGIQAGRNAGCWTVGVTRTGNCVGLTKDEYDALPPHEQSRRCKAAADRLTAAGAHYIIESVADLPDVILKIDEAAEA